ncbi:unnamed protein product [Orchesella dallaii]|uniref:Pickpocket protein 28 n=1 Tax=Orchesella dallaii TaxID=48710 RepID=A0ABP1RVE9_9HEXA
MAENHDTIEVQETSEDKSADGCGKWNFWRWKSDKNTVVSEFLTESSLHGLKYIGEPQRHIVERAFWIVTFIVGVAAAGYLIYEVFDRYEETPVIVSFQSKEQSVDTIPFPAVTFCFNMQFTKEKVESLNRSRDAFVKGEPEYDAISEKLDLIDSIWKSRKSFFRAYSGNIVYYLTARNDYYYIKNQSKLQEEIIDILLEFTPSCEDMIPFVMLDGSNIYKSKVQIFNPVITEYGKCCTFNMLPTPLMFKQPSVGKENVGDLFSNPVLGTKSKMWWNQADIDDWQKWSYEKGFILSPDSYKSQISWRNMKLSHPFRNQRLGYSYGLSVVIKTFEPYRDDITFHGTTFMLNNPVDTPRVSQFPSVIGSKQEVFIKIHPDITIADPDIKDLKIEKRQCLFGKDKRLKYFRPYTQDNCFEDCIANLIETECGCSMFYMPRPNETVLCELFSMTFEGTCVSDTLSLLNKKEICGDCLPLCEYIDYNFEMSTANILDWYNSLYWSLPNFQYGGTTQLSRDRDEIYRNISIVHIFYQSPSTVPKLRKRLYGKTDLIANTGGILGLCLGFSVLSVAEFLYYVLMRTVWQIFSKRYVWCSTKADSTYKTTETLELKTIEESNNSGSDNKPKFKRTKEFYTHCCKKRNGLLKFKWLCCILVVLVASSFLVYMLLVRNEENLKMKDSFKASLDANEDHYEYWAEATFCYTNQFSLEKVLELRRVAESTTDENRRYSAETNLTIIDAMCKYKDAFETSSSSKFSPINPDVANYTFLMKFLEENTISCGQMFPACVYMGVVQENCREIIQPVHTAYGKCCRVMMVPAKLKGDISDDKIANITEQPDNLSYKIENSLLFGKTKLNSSYFLVHGAILPKGFSTYRQPFHFSVLSNLNQDAYQCGNTRTSTNHILFSLHSPGKFPQMQDFASLPVANEEVVLTLFPEKVSHESLQERINNENIKYTPVEWWDDDLGFILTTKAAYFEGCSRGFISSNCKCALFGYEWQYIESRTCVTGSNSTDTICLKKMNELVKKVKGICSCTGSNCKDRCIGTFYSYTATNQSMRNASIPWTNNKTGIIHFTFNTSRQASKSTNNVSDGGIFAIILITAVASLICLSVIVFPHHLWRCICCILVKCTLCFHGLFPSKKTSALNTNNQP